MNCLFYVSLLVEFSNIQSWKLQEVDAVQEVLGIPDVLLICPFFEQGGRYTVNDIHYVQDGEMYYFS